jgi:hypothetical protein
MRQWLPTLIGSIIFASLTFWALKNARKTEDERDQAIYEYRAARARRSSGRALIVLHIAASRPLGIAAAIFTGFWCLVLLVQTFVGALHAIR